MFLNLTPTPKGQKKALKGPKKCKRGPKCVRFKPKDRAVLQEPKLIFYIVRSQKVFEPDPNPRNSPEGPKKCKKGPKFGQTKNKKIWLCFQNQI